MNDEQANERERMSAYINECGDEIAKHTWADSTGQHFNDKYKVLQAAFLKRGHEGVKQVVTEAIKAWLPRKAAAGRKCRSD